MASIGDHFCAFPSVDSIPLLDCILCRNSPFPETLNHAIFVCVHLPSSNKRCWLRARFADYVGENDIIISPQLFSYCNSLSTAANMNSQLVLTICDIHMQDKSPVESPSNLVIRACSSSKVTHVFEDHHSWNSKVEQIPASIETIICKFLSDVCSSYVFSFGCQFLFPYLDTILAFEVVSSDAISSLFSVTAGVNVIIEKTRISDPNQADHHSDRFASYNSLYKPLFSQDLFFMSSAVRRSLFVLDAVLNDSQRFPDVCFHNSILLQGAKGIGKSYLLHGLFEYCQHYQPNFSSLNIPEILFLDCKEIVRQRLRPSPNIIQPDISMADILSAFRYMCQKRASNQTSNSKVVIFIDHLDEILELFVEESLQDRAALSTASVNNTRHYLAFLLYHLLLNQRKLQDNSVGNQQLSENEQDLFPVVSVFGATRLSVQSLPRSSSGCPEFQSVVSLPKPTQTDREHLWKHLFLNFSMLKQQSKAKTTSLSSCIKLMSLTIPTVQNKEEETDSEVSAQWSAILAEATRGYLPGDLMRILETAVNIAQRQQNNVGITTLQWEHMIAALAEVVPASVLEISLELHPDLSPSLSWDHFIGYQDTKRHVQRVMKTICYHPPSSHGSGEKVKTLLGSKASKGMVVYGVSGCGKSYLVQTMAKELKMNFVTVTGGDMLSKYFGDTEARIRSIFQRARNAAPCILYFDNFDALAHRRGSEEASTTTSGNIGNRILSTFLNELDGVGTEAIVETDGTTTSAGAGATQGGEQVVFVIVSCADISQLDEALIRPGRLQHHIHLDYPNLDDMTALLEYFFRSTNVHESVDFKHIASVIDSRSRTLGYKQKYLSVTKLMEMKEQVLSFVIEEFLQSHPEIQSKLENSSKRILLGNTENYDFQPLLTTEDVQGVLIYPKHIMQIVDKLFPEEKPAFEFSTPFSGKFSFNVGSSFS